MARHRELGLTDHEYELIVEKMEREPNEVELAVFSLMWSEHCGYKHSRRLLKTLPVEGGEADPRPGRERRRGRGRRRAGVRVQGRVAQPPERGRALPGRRHRRRRDPARRVRDRRAADRDPGLAALRRGVDLAALALPARAGGRGHRPLRQLDRRRDGRRRDLLRGPVRAELPRQRHVRRADRGRQADQERGGGRRQHGRAVRRAHGARRDRRRVGAGVRRAGRRGRRQAPDRADRRPVRGEEAARVLAGAARPGAAGGAAGPRRRGADLLVGRDGGQGRASASTSTCARCRCARPTWSPSRS